MNGGDGGDVAAAPADPPPPLDWIFSQVSGELTAGEEVPEVNITSAIDFDKSGYHLAIGDRRGKVVLFERTDAKEHDGNRKRLITPYTNEFRQNTSLLMHKMLCYVNNYELFQGMKLRRLDLQFKEWKRLFKSKKECPELLGLSFVTVALKFILKHGKSEKDIQN